MRVFLLIRILVRLMVNVCLFLVKSHIRHLPIKMFALTSQLLKPFTSMSTLAQVTDQTDQPVISIPNASFSFMKNHRLLLTYVPTYQGKTLLKLTLITVKATPQKLLVLLIPNALGPSTNNLSPAQLTTTYALTTQPSTMMKSK